MFYSVFLFINCINFMNFCYSQDVSNKSEILFDYGISLVATK